MDQLPTIQLEEADDAQGMLYIWMCPLCGQPMKEGERCNSGVHQGPDTVGTEGTERDTRPFAVRSIDIDVRILRIEEVVRDLVAHEDQPCRFDHHGYCQEHGWLTDGVCAIARGRQLLGLTYGPELPVRQED